MTRKQCVLSQEFGVRRINYEPADRQAPDFRLQITYSVRKDLIGFTVAALMVRAMINTNVAAHKTPIANTKG